MKVRINRQRRGKKLQEPPKRITCYNDKNEYIGAIFFEQEYGNEIRVVASTHPAVTVRVLHIDKPTFRKTDTGHNWASFEKAAPAIENYTCKVCEKPLKECGGRHA